MTVEPLDPRDRTLGVWSPGIIDDDEVVLELEPLSDDDPRVQQAEALLTQQVLGGDE